MVPKLADVICFIYTVTEILLLDTMVPKLADVICFIYTVMMKAGAQNFRTTFGLCILQESFTSSIPTKKYDF